MHYRNLIEFLGKPPKEETDLAILRPDTVWAPRDGVESGPPDARVLRQIAAEGSKLWEKYEGRKLREDTISRYLQHCTTYRKSFKNWYVVEMMEEIRPLLKPIVESLPTFTPATSSSPVDRTHYLGGEAASTHSGSAGSLLFESAGPEISVRTTPRKPRL